MQMDARNGRSGSMTAWTSWESNMKERIMNMQIPWKPAMRSMKC